MQLKGLVRILTIALILICAYQLSFTWITYSYEKEVKAKATAQIKKNYPALKGVDFEEAVDARQRFILDSTKDKKIGPFEFVSYKSAKNQELALGLDLQGGMSVTLEVGMSDLIKTLADYTKDGSFTTALDNATKTKANTNLNLVNLFVDEYEKALPTGKLAPFFVNKSSGKITMNSTNKEVKSYLTAQSEEAFKNTERILRTRIDRFGVASPNINADPSKAIINVELAGIKDEKRVREIIIKTANLQFFEVYNIGDIGNELVAGDKALQDFALNNNDTLKKVTDSTIIKANQNPILRLLQLTDRYQDPQTKKVVTPATIGFVRVIDTPKLNKLLNDPVFTTKMAKFPNLAFMYGKAGKDNDGKEQNFIGLYAIKTLENGQAELEGDRIANARQDYNGSQPIIQMTMDKEGTNLWGQLTTKNVNKPVAVVLDNIVYTAPNVNEPIMNGTSQISGGFDVKEAQDLAQILETGKLPAPAKIVQLQTIGATLGEAAVKGGAMSFLVSFIVIFLLMLVYYNTAGWVANIALILNIFFTVGILASFGFTLTAAGIAGLVLTIGMAVDTNVIIFERIKEELTKGKNHTAAVADGYKRSLAPILDAHVTSFLTAFILFIFGLGPVLGFATTQMLGITLSLFCGILVSRLVTEMYASGKSKKHFEYFTGFSKKIFKHASYKFIEYRKFAYAISAVVLVLGIASFFNGFDEGVEFAGGRSYTINFPAKEKIEEVRESLKVAFENETPIVKTIGTGNELNITTAYKIKDNRPEAELEVEQALFKGLQKYLPADVDFKTFLSDKYKKSSQTVLPSISADLKKGAIQAGIYAILIICFYIFIRFRDWRYSVGTIVALLHDVLVTLAVFSFCRKLVPFPLEIDQHFIAAVLTVIGFSMNDTVIVYDRIREDSKLYPNLSKESLINTAINQTLSRTVMTSLTVFLTILILFIFGGEVTRGFAFAMLIGVVTGTYSSIFVAAPILVDFAKNKPLGKVDETAKPIIKA